ncbi:GyrI-like domain-containing protein [uncultured Georgenia sp.]|uniref:GyrI-like domain-containing protein n=1 Tax=uncultured Georgenia sp. TaxID=378209 RepID=UPI0026127BD9|nr:GyrI-like domain-containing protein [uncultured Georgenia sp.]HLV04405.1 GyrI-like domain-containing protein [Actinomycetaceae bacterium]
MTDIEMVERGPAVIVGVPVIGTFAELGRLVPEAWRRLHDRVGQDSDLTLAEVSVDLGDGRYHETLGALTGAREARRLHIPGCVCSYVPGGRWVQTIHEGPERAIADTFGRLLDRIAADGGQPGPHKLDIGYTVDGEGGPHLLAVQLA